MALNRTEDVSNELLTSYIDSVSGILKKVLPSRTGYTISEIELNSQYNTIRTLILKKITEEEQNELHIQLRTHFISALIKSLCDICDSISMECENIRMKDREEKSLGSTLVVLRFLKEIVQSCWQSDADLTSLNSEIFSTNFRLPSTYAIYYHYKIPPPLDSGVIHPILTSLLSLTSYRIFGRVLEELKMDTASNSDRTTTRNSSHHFEYSSSNIQNKSLGAAQDKAKLDLSGSSSQSNTVLSKSSEDSFGEEYTNEYLSEIDTCIEVVLRFLGCTNPSDYYDYVYEKLLTLPLYSESISPAYIQRYAPLLKFIRFSGHQMVSTYINNMHYLVSSLKFHNWRLAVLFFGAVSIKDQFLSRPEDFEKFVKKEQPSGVKLFDFIIAMLESSPPSTAATMIKSWYSIFCLSDFLELELKPSKLKINFNYRLKFITSALKFSKSNYSLDSFDALLNYFFLGASLGSINLDNAISRFTTTHLGDTYEALSKIHHQSMENDVNYHIIDNLVINFFICALLIEPENYFNALVKIFKSSYTNLRIMRMMIKITKALSDLENGGEVCNRILSNCASELRNSLFYLIRLLIAKNSINTLESVKSVSSVDVDAQISASQQASIRTSEERSMSSKKNITLDNQRFLLGSFLQSINTRLDNQEQEDVVLSSLIQNGGKFLSPDEVLKSKIQLNYDFMISDLYLIFEKRPEIYCSNTEFLNFSDSKTYERFLASQIKHYAHGICVPIRFALVEFIKNQNYTLFETANKLVISIITNSNSFACHSKEISLACWFAIGNEILEIICDECNPLQLTAIKFKSCFLFMKTFFEVRKKFLEELSDVDILKCKELHSFCFSNSSKFEELIIFALSRNDIQIFEIARFTVNCYFGELDSVAHFEECMIDSSEKLLKELVDVKVNFTGFVSYHKRFRKILQKSKPTKSLLKVWLGVYIRWLDILDQKTLTEDDNTAFYIYTGLLVSISGCFYGEDFNMKKDLKAEALEYIQEFYRRSAKLLSSSDFKIRSVVRNSLSQDAHPFVYKSIVDEMIKLIKSFSEVPPISRDGIAYIDQAILVIIGMLSLRNEGSFVLTAALPSVLICLCSSISSIRDPLESVRLKSRFCKLLAELASDQKTNGLLGAFKIRNFYAKLTCDWLTKAMNYQPPSSVLSSEISAEKKSRSRGSTIQSSSSQNEVISNNLEFEGFNNDLILEASKSLSLQLHNLRLHIPEGVKDKDIKANKNLAFAPYLSLMYRTLQKYLSSPKTKTKGYRKNQVVENVLKSITNLMKFEADLGTQFVLPLGLHENNTIRAYFLTVFANMLEARKSIVFSEEFPMQMISRMTGMTHLLACAAKVSPLTEHNLLAASLYSTFAYIKGLDTLFSSLLSYEISKISRSSELLRGNSILTKLISVLGREVGSVFLKEILENIIKEMITQNIEFEIEKDSSTLEDTDVFMVWFKRVMNAIFRSVDYAPQCFRYLCSEIYRQVGEKFHDAALVAVGAFVFLRLICPVIISPESFFDVSIENPKVRRSFLQLAKVMQNMANGSLSTMKSPTMLNKAEELNEINEKIFQFLKKFSEYDSQEYAFPEVPEKPIPEMRYLHHFFYNYFTDIKYEYLVRRPINSLKSLSEHVAVFENFDQFMSDLGQPMALVSLTYDDSIRASDAGSLSGKFNEFMNKMVFEYLHISTEYPLAHSAIFDDGTPIVVVNLYYSKIFEDDAKYLVYKIFEQASMIWENKFYLAFDFTDSILKPGIVDSYYKLIKELSPQEMLDNCTRIYYLNLPRQEYNKSLESVKEFRLKVMGAQLHIYSTCDNNNVPGNINLNPNTLSIMDDERISFKEVIVLDKYTNQWLPVILKIGRQWLQIYCTEESIYYSHNDETVTYKPAEVYRLSDLVSCELSHYTDRGNEFTLNFAEGDSMILSSSEKDEILKFLYFATTRLPNEIDTEESEMDVNAEWKSNWFSCLYNICFHGLLSTDEETKTSASLLFAALSAYFETDFGITVKYAQSLSFPANVTDFIISVSTYLADHFSSYTYDFLHTFLDYFDKLQDKDKLNAIQYISPWVGNACENIFLVDRRGPDLTASIIRRFCKLSFENKNQMTCLYDFVWKKLFEEERLSKVLLDEIITFTIHNKKDDPDWDYMNSVIIPSVDICGEIVSRLISCVKTVSADEPTIVLEGKLFEMKVLVKICSSLFFNYNEFNELFTAEIFLLSVLSIDNPMLDFGADVQKLFTNTLHSYLQKVDITKPELDAVEETLQFFTGDRGKLLFGLTRDKSVSNYDLNQVVNRCNTLDFCVQALVRFMDVMYDSNKSFGLKTKFSSLAIEIAFKKSTIFSSRAFLIVGILSKKYINDTIAARVVKAGTKNSSRLFADQHIILSYSYSCIFNGLSKNSTLISYFLWHSLYHGLLAYTSSYQAGSFGLLSLAVKTIKANTSYLDEIFECKSTLEPFISDISKRSDITVTKENFEIVVIFTLSKGLRYTHLKHNTLKHLKHYYAFAKELELDPDYNKYRSYSISTPVLLYIYLAMSSNDFEEYIKESKIAVEWVVIRGNTRCPKQLIDFVIEDTDYSAIFKVLLSELFKTKIDTTFKVNFLYLHDYIHLLGVRECSPYVYWFKDELKQILIETDRTDLIEICSSSLCRIICQEPAAMDKSKDELETLLNNYSLMFIKEHKFVKSDLVEFKDERSIHHFEALVADLREILYRCSCSFVENRMLED